MSQKTVLNDTHRALGAKMVDFGGWDMPIHYGSQIDEHHQVRRDAGMFDVSHMTVVDLTGARTREFLRHLVANSVDKLQKPGKALYTTMLNPQGGVIDDLIVYFMSEDWFRLVVNAATREKDVAWITAQAAAFAVEVKERPEFGMVAVQGPNARERVIGLLREEDRAPVSKLARFAAREARTTGGVEVFVARTGYTGEDGFEVIVPEAQTVAFWNALLAAGVKPAALEAQQAAGTARQMVGLVMDEKGVLRHGQKVVTANGEGEILSGTFSPSIGKAIAFARIPAGAPGDVRVDIRGREVPVRVVRFPFVRDNTVQPGI